MKAIRALLLALVAAGTLSACSDIAGPDSECPVIGGSAGCQVDGATPVIGGSAG